MQQSTALLQVFLDAHRLLLDNILAGDGGANGSVLHPLCDDTGSTILSAAQSWFRYWAVLSLLSLSMVPTCATRRIRDSQPRPNACTQYDRPSPARSVTCLPPHPVSAAPLAAVGIPHCPLAGGLARTSCRLATRRGDGSLPGEF